MIRVPLREGRTLHHDVRGHFGAGKVVFRVAEQGTGIIAGGPMRAMFEALGVHDVVAKSIGTSNPHNMVKAAFCGADQQQLAPLGRGPPRPQGQRHSRPPQRRRRGDGVRIMAAAKKGRVEVTQIGSPIGRRKQPAGHLERPRPEQAQPVPGARGYAVRAGHDRQGQAPAAGGICRLTTYLD